MNFKHSRPLFAASVLAVLSLGLTGCSGLNPAGSSADASTERSAATAEQGVKDGLLAPWAPAGATDVKLKQRNSGAERIVAMNYAGRLEAKECKPIKTVGEPTPQELASAYASDERVKSFKPDELSQSRTLEADWWPADAQAKTTTLCGRFWVHQADGKLYAFAPDTKAGVDSVMKARQSDKDA